MSLGRGLGHSMRSSPQPPRYEIWVLLFKETWNNIIKVLIIPASLIFWAHSHDIWSNRRIFFCLQVRRGKHSAKVSSGRFGLGIKGWVRVYSLEKTRDEEETPMGKGERVFVRLKCLVWCKGPCVLHHHWIPGLSVTPSMYPAFFF